MSAAGEQERFCAEAYPRLVAGLTHYCGDVHLAEEFAQTALLKACRRWPQVREMVSPIGWSYRVGANAANSWFRRRAAEMRARARLGGPPAADVEDHADRLAVRAALSGLTDRQREAVILRYYLDLSVEEAAAVLDSTPGAVRALTHRAIAVLRDVFADAPTGHELQEGDDE